MDDDIKIDPIAELSLAAELHDTDPFKGLVDLAARHIQSEAVPIAERENLRELATALARDWVRAAVAGASQDGTARTLSTVQCSSCRKLAAVPVLHDELCEHCIHEHAAAKASRIR